MASKTVAIAEAQVVPAPLLTQNQQKRLENLIWILRRKFCSLKSYKYGDAISLYRAKEKRLTMLILLAASCTSSFTLGTMNSSAQFFKYIGVGISFVTTIISGVQKVQNYPDQIDRGAKMAEDWRKISNTINLRLNKMDEADQTGLISEEDAVNGIGDMKVQDLNYVFPDNKLITETDITLKTAMKLLDSCVALKISGDCTKEKVDVLNNKIQSLLNPVVLGDDDAV